MDITDDMVKDWFKGRKVIRSIMKGLLLDKTDQELEEYVNAFITGLNNEGMTIRTVEEEVVV